MVPIEFVILERPVSQQARRRERVREWKAFVTTYAVRAGAPKPATEPVSLTLVYFYQEAALDLDNILKPIQDALVGTILTDDAIVTDVEMHRRWLRSPFVLEAVSPVLAAGIGLGKEFVYVMVQDAPAQGRLA